MTNPLQEDKGLIEIHRICTNMSAIWRPTPCHDLGIDGQIEFIEPGTSISTGHIVAVQSKSGPSYFQNQDSGFVKYYPSKKHLRYWQRLKVPVILVLHNPEESLTLYTKVKPQLGDKGPIMVNKKQIFEPSCRDILMGMADDVYKELSPKKVLDKFKKITLTRESNKILTGIDFLLACTNRPCKYFEIRMCRISAIFDLICENTGYSITQEDYDYILRNVITIYSEKMAGGFFEEFEDMWYGLQIVPDISSPLTGFGQDVIDYLWSHLDDYLSHEIYLHLECYSSTDLAERISKCAQILSDKLDASDRLASEPR